MYKTNNIMTQFEQDMTQFEQDLERAVENNKRQEADIEHLENIIKIMRETILDYSNRLDTTSNIKTS